VSAALMAIDAMDVHSVDIPEQPGTCRSVVHDDGQHVRLDTYSGYNRVASVVLAPLAALSLATQLQGAALSHLVRTTRSVP
jgi:hypothetical protein